MASRRRKSKDDSRGLLLYALVVLVITVVVSAAVYMPIIFIAILLIYRTKSYLIPREDPGDETLSELKAIEDELFSKIRRLEEVNARADEADLQINADGSFHRGSSLGKRLNKERDILLPEIDRLSERSDKIRSEPIDIVQRRIRTRSVEAAAFLTIAINLLLISIIYFNFGNKIESISNLAMKYTVYQQPWVPVPVYGSALAAGALSVVIFFVVYLMSKRFIRAGFRGREQRWQEFAEGGYQYTADQHDEGVDEEAASYRSSASSDEPAPGDEAEGRHVAWHEVLGVSVRATVMEINSAYRAKMMKNHPDRVADLDEEFRALADARAKLLNWARDEGLRARA